MRRSTPMLRCMLAVLFVIQPALTAPARGEKFLLSKLKRLVTEAEYHGTEPCTGCDGAIECLAENIDWLEHHIDAYGSIVAKQPDIWGEARLTKHRDEYERVLFAELDDFKATINAAISQTDSSFLAQAIALSNAAAGTAVNAAPSQEKDRPTVAIANAQLKAADDLSNDFKRFGISADRNPAEPMITLEPVIHLDQLSRYVQHLHELRRINEGDDTSDSPGYSLNLVRIPVSILPGKMTRTGFGAEVTVTATPVLSDDLMPTTFRNLAVNDVVDMLGLPVVRAAERFSSGDLKYTIARRIIQENAYEIESLYTEFHRWFADALNRPLEEEERDQLIEQKSKVLIDAVTTRLESVLSDPGAHEVFVGLIKLAHAEESRLEAADESIKKYLPAGVTREVGEALMRSGALMRYKKSQSVVREPSPFQKYQQRAPTTEIEEIPGPLPDPLEAIGEHVLAGDARQAAVVLSTIGNQSASANTIRDIVQDALDLLSKKEQEQLRAVVPSGRSRRALDPINPSFVKPVVGVDSLVKIVESFEPAYNGRYIRWNGGQKCQEMRVDLLDARRFLQAQLEAAYELLAQPGHVCLYARLAAKGSGLSQQIRAGHLTAELNTPNSPIVAQYRHYFFEKLHQEGAACLPFACEAGGPTIPPEEIFSANKVEEARNSVEALAWALVVESALLNDRLNLDVRKLAKAKEVYDLNTARDYYFFIPDTTVAPGTGLEELSAEFQQATQIFQRYVQARWPIHVFAIDPREQDQNVADVSQRKRELQFALALGFSTGQIGVNSLTQFSRELETQIETISLNRTVVGFGHGADTFGWRFMPRVQALPVPGTLGAIRETICGASRDYDLKHRQLEPGQRECVAVVLMPSFVPYADFDIRTNWFKLTNPKNAALTMKDTMRLSRAVTAMRNSRAQCAKCQHLYRDGELGRLFKRVEQLDRELPLQTQRALVPYENTLGGFEMFNTGVTDLSPELIGWYGAPGVVVRETSAGCGCYQGCQLGPGACSGDNCASVATTVSSLTSRVATLEAGNRSYAASPIPACNGPGTTLFLVGDNFSVHDTKVIAGGVCIPHVQLISRELMRVTIPDCVSTVHLCENGVNNEYVSVYVATPYGVTNHLHVPTDRPVEKPTPGEAEVIHTTITAAVKTAKNELLTSVSDRFAGHELPLRKIALSKTFNTLVFDCTQDQTTGVFNPEDKKQIEYRVQSDPQLGASRGANVEFSVALWGNGQYLSPLQAVQSTAEINDCGRFNALPSDQGAAFAGLIKECLSCNCRCQGESPNQFRLVYYAKAEGESMATRLAHIDLIVKATEADCLEQSAAAGTVGTTVNSGGIVSEGSQPQDCGCEPTRAAGLFPVRPISHHQHPAGVAPSRYGGNGILVAPAQQRQPQASVGRGVPARYAYQAEGDLDPEANDAVLDRLERVTEELAANTLQQKLLQERFAQLEATSQMPSQTALNLNVSYPPLPAPAEEDCWWDKKKHPLVNQATTRARECWHNVRDQLPCN